MTTRRFALLSLCFAAAAASFGILAGCGGKYVSPWSGREEPLEYIVSEHETEKDRMLEKAKADVKAADEAKARVLEDAKRETEKIKRTAIKEASKVEVHARSTVGDIEANAVDSMEDVAHTAEVALSQIDTDLALSLGEMKLKLDSSASRITAYQQQERASAEMWLGLLNAGKPLIDAGTTAATTVNPLLGYGLTAGLTALCGWLVKRTGDKNWEEAKAEAAKEQAKTDAAWEEATKLTQSQAKEEATARKLDELQAMVLTLASAAPTKAAA